MIEVADYYSFAGVPKTSNWEDVKKKVHKLYLEYQRKANSKGPGSKEAQQRDFWAKALAFFKDEASKKAYDAQLEAWLRSPAAQEAKAKSRSAADEFAQKATVALELLQQAWRELERGNIPEAMVLAGKALTLDPGSWEVYFALGVANFRWNDLDEAMSCLRSAARLNPKSADVFAGIGEIYERQERWKDAYEQYRRAATIEPDVLAHQISMGLICVKAGVPDEGIEILRACQAKDPDDPGLNWVLGVALAESARLGWTYVPDGHPRVSEGWYAMSRAEALQGVEKLNEAHSLKIEDAELVQELAEVRADVEKNVKRKFIGNWVLLGLISVVGLFTFNSNVTFALLLFLFAAVYYAANLAPQYAINARVLKGESAIKQNFFEKLEGANGWVQLFVYTALIGLLPLFTLYWGIRNWTGLNAPLGKVVDDIRAKHSPAPAVAAGDSPSEEVQPQPIAQPSASSAPGPAAAGFDLDTGGTAQARAATPVAKMATAQAMLGKASEATAAAGKAATAGLPIATKVLNAFSLANKTMTMVTIGVVVLVVALGVLYFGRSRNEEQLRAELEQKAAQLRVAEERANTAAEESRRQEVVRQQERDRIARAEADAAAARAQQQTAPAPEPSAIPATPLSPPTAALPSGDQILQPRIRIGDRHTFETIDMVDSRLNNVVAREVLSISGDEVTMKFVNQKSSYERLLTYTRDLGLLRSRSGAQDGSNYSPAIKYVQVPGRIGESWESRSTETNIKTGKTRLHVVRARIEGKETVTVPAGSFEAFRIVLNSEVQDDGKVSTGQDISWFSPQVGRSVKSELRSRDATGKEGHRVVQLVSYSLGQ